MWNHFSRLAREAVGQAATEAMGLGQDYVALGHLLLGLVGRNHNVAFQVLERLGVSVAFLRKAITQHLLAATENSVAGLQLTVDAQEALQAAFDEARLLHNNYIGTEHMLLALAGEADKTGQVLRRLGATQEQVRQEIESLQAGLPAAEARRTMA